MLCDRQGFATRLQAANQRMQRGEPVDRMIGKLQLEIEASRARCEARAARFARIDYDDELPVAAARADIAAVIDENQVVVIGGETGSGKTTQLPKICLGIGRGAAGIIGHTQPRRIAARSVAGRIASELGAQLGREVGYQVRFSDRTGRDTQVKLMTDGILLAETQGDRELRRYDTIIIDEAHERSLNIDFLLGYLRGLLPRRPELKVIVTSATIDLERFARHFDGAPVLEVSGRSYPVEVRWRPPDDLEDDDYDQAAAIGAAVEELMDGDRTGDTPGDILVFLAGEREIRDTAEALRRFEARGCEVLPLFSRLGAGQQDRIWQPHLQRRIVLATNVAETSITVPGVRFVIDPGFARISRYGFRSRVQRLPIEPVSRASADQRKGRCGRVAAGICIRLYEEKDFDGRPRFTDPEVLRTNLAAVILRMKALELGDIQSFPFLDSPDRRQISDGLRHLYELGAIDEEERLTALGRDLARLPIDPALGRMILAAGEHDALSEVLVIASALAIPDPRERTHDSREAADAAHAEFAHPDSDFLSILNLWQAYRREEKRRSGSQLRKLCREKHLSFQRMREWSDVHLELRQLAHDLGLRTSRAPAPPEHVHLSLLAGLLSNVGMKTERNEYLGVRGTRFHVFPGSILFARKPPWMMAAELVETTRLYARSCAVIEPEWIEATASHLVKRTLSDPRWEERTEQAVATERVTFQGLPVAPERQVAYGRIDPVASRHLLLRALADGTYRPRAAAFEHNARVMREVEALEERTRRRDALVDLQTIYDFYDTFVPPGVTCGRELLAWLREAEKEDGRILRMTREDLTRRDATVATEEQFPGSLPVGESRLPLSYRFSPGDPADGVTLEVPLAALNQVSEARTEWLVPGLLEEKVLALLRGLPKELRRSFVPAPDVAARALAGWRPSQARLLPALSDRLLELVGVRVPVEAWRPEALPDHLRMRFALLDAGGREIDRGRDLRELQERHSAQVMASLAGLPGADLERAGLDRWSFGDLPERISVPGEGITLVGFPAVVDEGETVALRVLESPLRAARATRAGLVRLFELEHARDVAALARAIPDLDRMALAARRIAPGVTAAELRCDIVAAAIARAQHALGAVPRTAAAWQQSCRAVRARLGEDTAAVAREVAATLADATAALAQVQGEGAAARRHAHADIREQIQHLLPRGFVRATPPEWLPQLPRYLKAVLARLEKLRYAADKDADRTRETRMPWEGYLARARQMAERGVESEALERFRYMVEEYRVSLFAQEVGTSCPVSKKRLAELWKEMR